MQLHKLWTVPDKCLSSSLHAFHFCRWYDALTRLLGQCSQSWAELSQSEQMSAGITIPARARVSITANLIICQCVSWKIFPGSLHWDVSWARQTSESKRPFWPIRTCSFHSSTGTCHLSLTGEMQILMMSQSGLSPDDTLLLMNDCLIGVIDLLRPPDNIESSVDDMKLPQFSVYLRTGREKTSLRRNIWVWFKLFMFLSQHVSDIIYKWVTML